jgi:hypothetical protein
MSKSKFKITNLFVEQSIEYLEAKIFILAQRLLTFEIGMKLHITFMYSCQLYHFTF